MNVKEMPGLQLENMRQLHVKVPVSCYLMVSTAQPQLSANTLIFQLKMKHS